MYTTYTAVPAGGAPCLFTARDSCAEVFECTQTRVCVRGNRVVTKVSTPPTKAQRDDALRSKLAKLGIYGRWDLVLHLPMRYEDETKITPLRQAREDCPVLIEATVLSNEVRNKPRPQLIVQLAEDPDKPHDQTIVARFIHFYPSQVKQFSVGRRMRLFGDVRPGFFGAEMVHPRAKAVAPGDPLAQSLTPVYPTTAGISQDRLRTLVLKTLAQTELTDSLPDDVRTQLDVMSFRDAVIYLHEPPPDAALNTLTERTHPAWRRLKFDELLAQQLAMQVAHNERRAQVSPSLPAKHHFTRTLIRSLPFSLTKAQQKTSKEIAADLAHTHPMQRLLQGDVGSGKTLVATLAALQAIENDYQAAFMAPTEILAEQHYRKISAMLTPLGIKVAWLAGALKAREKEKVRASIAFGEVQLAIGTHALLTEGTTFNKLGLAIIDEQHRFGVAQRLQLRDKAQAGQHIHQLMMSATPIPRTLAMTYWADLDVSVIDQMPPGRKPILTNLVAETRRDEVIGHVRKAIADGAQAYWVCPLIEESEKLQLETATQTFETISQTFPDLRIGLVHGRLKAAEKEAVMTAFVHRDIDLLVATTVIEVGVDVANAALMVIENAERMGLSQLHQLRGRVGRGTRESRCILLYKSPLSETARARLKVIYESTDGFEIARQDLLIRGPGEFLGARQSGEALLRFADPERDADLIEQAHDTAQAWLRDDPARADAHRKRWMGERQRLLQS